MESSSIAVANQFSCSVGELTKEIHISPGTCIKVQKTGTILFILNRKNEYTKEEWKYIKDKIKMENPFMECLFIHKGQVQEKIEAKVRGRSISGVMYKTFLLPEENEHILKFVLPIMNHKYL